MACRLHENEARAQELEEEKMMYNEQAHDLQETIKVHHSLDHAHIVVVSLSSSPGTKCQHGF